MSNDAIANLTATRDKFMAPVAKLNKLTVAKVEELTALELSSLNAYTNLGLAQLKAAVEVSDAEGFKAFAESQSEAFKSLSEKLVADAKEVAKIGETYREEAMGVAREVAAEVKPA